VSGKNVLVADVTDDLKSERMELCKYLELYGVNVTPTSGYSDDDDKFIDAYSSDLRTANLFVQLLSEVRSPKLIAAQISRATSRARFQFEKAKESQVPVMQWLRPGSDPTSITHWDKAVIDGSLAGSNIDTSGFVQFKTRIKEALERKPDVSHTGGFYYINADRSDQGIAGNLLKALKNKNCDALGPLFPDAAPSEEVERDREGNLIDCKGLVLVYGNAPATWVRAQVRRYFKVAAKREQPVTFKKILCMPGCAKDDIGVSGFDTIECDEAALHKVVEELPL
jgi:hypothetical protein